MSAVAIPGLWIPPPPRLLGFDKAPAWLRDLKARYIDGQWRPYSRLQLGEDLEVISRPFALSFVNSATSSASTITIPADAAAGDWAVLFDGGRAGAGTPTAVTPTNWTQFTNANDTGSNFRVQAHWKKLVGGDPGSSVTGMNTSSMAKMMFVFRGTAAIGTVTPGTFNHEATANDPALQTVSASGGAAPLVVVAAAYDFDAGGSVDFSTASPAFDAKTSRVNSRGIAGYKIYNSSPADHSIDMNDLGSRNALHSVYVALAP